jgi:hypothetical protein
MQRVLFPPDLSVGPLGGAPLSVSFARYETQIA